MAPSSLPDRDSAQTRDPHPYHRDHHHHHHNYDSRYSQAPLPDPDRHRRRLYNRSEPPDWRRSIIPDDDVGRDQVLRPHDTDTPSHRRRGRRGRRPDDDTNDAARPAESEDEGPPRYVPNHHSHRRRRAASLTPRGRGATRSRDDGRRRHQSEGADTRRRRRSPYGDNVDEEKKESRGSRLLKHVMWQTAVMAGARAAMGVSRDPGPWLGEKGAKVAAAGLSAILVDSFLQKRHPKRLGGMRHRAAREGVESTLSRAAVGVMRR